MTLEERSRPYAIGLAALAALLVVVAVLVPILARPEGAAPRPEYGRVVPTPVHVDPAVLEDARKDALRARRAAERGVRDEASGR